MHDWTLVTIHYEWKTAVATLSFRGPGRSSASIVATDVSRLEIPHESDWGPSISVNEIRGPHDIGGRCQLEVEMQSGDVITLTAASVAMPNAAPNHRALFETVPEGN